ncbi:MAG: hypothetical protein OJF49_004231 [Ktedonobacterales bacterium]|jgi:hypothetical protein|nr:MAG: hypothetical protein OJF49_004231 [Ktedonobacterales bacterium]
MRKGAIPVVALLACILAALAGCSQQQNTVRIAGTIQGDAANSSTSSSATIAPVAGKVICNGTTVKAASDGSYALTVPAAKSYTCVASSPPAYGEQQVIISGHTEKSIALNFGTSQAPACQLNRISFAIDCQRLHFQPGELHGRVTFTHSGGPAANINIQCPDLDHYTGTSNDGSVQWVHTRTDSAGFYTLKNISIGSFNCLAQNAHGDVTMEPITTSPGSNITADLKVCDSNCPPVKYHFGNVMHEDHVYVIFWLPPSYTFDPANGDAHYESLIKRYFQDVGGTSFYNILTQYGDYLGQIRNTASLAGAWVDTSPYQHCGLSTTNCTPAAATRADPLLDNDIQSEVGRAVKANVGWRADANSSFFVLTGYGAQECITADANSGCTWKFDNGYCGYHDSFHINPQDATAPEAIYAYIPDAITSGATCSFGSGGNFVSPNHDPLADSAINVISHEQFESISDPLPNDAPGWYDDVAEHTREGGEIGDKCVTFYGNIGSDGGNVSLNGHRYIVQGEWSNLSNSCVMSQS